MNEQLHILHSFSGVIDSTLREGFQFSRANFSLDEQKQIFSYLVGIGVDYIEVANPAFDVTPAALIAAIVTEAGIARPPYDQSLPALFA